MNDELGEKTQKLPVPVVSHLYFVSPLIELKMVLKRKEEKNTWVNEEESKSKAALIKNSIAKQIQGVLQKIRSQNVHLKWHVKWRITKG